MDFTFESPGAEHVSVNASTSLLNTPEDLEYLKSFGRVTDSALKLPTLSITDESGKQDLKPDPALEKLHGSADRRKYPEGAPHDYERQERDSENDQITIEICSLFDFSVSTSVVRQNVQRFFDSLPEQDRLQRAYELQRKMARSNASADDPAYKLDVKEKDGKLLAIDFVCKDFRSWFFGLKRNQVYRAS